MYDDLRIALKGYYTTYKRKRYSKPLQTDHALRNALGITWPHYSGELKQENYL